MPEQIKAVPQHHCRTEHRGNGIGHILPRDIGRGAMAGLVPGHMNLDKIVDAVKLGVAEAGGVPVVFPAIAASRRSLLHSCSCIITCHTDSTECMAIAHQFDALVMVPNCDKNVPGLLMAAARLNLPTGSL